MSQGSHFFTTSHKHLRLAVIVLAGLVVAYVQVNQPRDDQSMNHGQSSQSASADLLPATPTPAPSVTPTPAPETNSSLSCIQALPDATKISQKLMFAGYASLLEGQHDSLSRINVGGLIIMDQTSEAQLKAFGQGFSIPPLIGVDQEGGPVQRYAADGPLPSAADVAAHYSVDQAYQLYLKDARYLKGLGLTTNFAPVVDVISRQPNPLPNRLYSSDPAVVVRYATSFIKASQTAGLTPVIKHFPGLGSASGNTDYGSATTDPFNMLQSRDILPYQQLAALKPDVMVSNAIVPQLTDGQPAVWSAAAVSLLRSYGYGNSLIYTDSLTASAIPGYLSQAAIKAWQADIDIAMIVQSRTLTSSLLGMSNTIIDQTSQALHSGQLNRDQLNQSVARIFKRKGVNPCRLAAL